MQISEHETAKDWTCQAPPATPSAGQAERLAFFSVGFGGYETYTGLYVYSLLRALPGARVIIDLEEENLADRFPVRAAVERFGGRVTLRSSRLGRFRSLASVPVAGGHLKLARWLTQAHDFTDSRFACITDIDIVFQPSASRDITLTQQILEKSKVPFLNSSRPMQFRFPGNWHWIRVDDYHSGIERVVQNFLTDDSFRSAVVTELQRRRYVETGGRREIPRDESYLAFLLQQGFPTSYQTSTRAAFPGVHIGAGRGGDGKLLTNGRSGVHGLSVRLKEIADEGRSDPMLGELLFRDPENNLLAAFHACNIDFPRTSTVRRFKIVGKVHRDRILFMLARWLRTLGHLNTYFPIASPISSAKRHSSGGVVKE